MRKRLLTGLGTFLDIGKSILRTFTFRHSGNRDFRYCCQVLQKRNNNPSTQALFGEYKGNVRVVGFWKMESSSYRRATLGEPDYRENTVKVYITE